MLYLSVSEKKNACEVTRCVACDERVVLRRCAFAVGTYSTDCTWRRAPFLFLPCAPQLEDDVHSALNKISLPARELAAYIETDFIFPDTAPRMAKLPDAVDGPAPVPVKSAPVHVQGPPIHVQGPPIHVQGPPIHMQGPSVTMQAAPVSHTYQLLSHAGVGRSMDNGSYI